MNLTARLVLTFALCISAALADASGDPRRLGGTAFPKRKRQPSVSQVRREQAERRDEKEKNEAKKTNPGKTLEIKAFCGRSFGSKDKEGREFTTVECDKPYFGGYRRLSLRYSPSAGLYSITAVNDDTFAIGDIDGEIMRIVKIVEEKFHVRFTGEIVHAHDAQYKHENYVSRRSNSITGGLSGYGVNSRLVLEKPATKSTSRIFERFKNVQITICGTHDLVNDRKRVDFTVELLGGAKKK